MDPPPTSKDRVAFASLVPGQQADLLQVPEGKQLLSLFFSIALSSPVEAGEKDYLHRSGWSWGEGKGSLNLSLA